MIDANEFTLYWCPACGGDGIEVCNNPDHGFPRVTPSGCPACGNDPDHKTGDSCGSCNGTGKVQLQKFKKIVQDGLAIGEAIQSDMEKK